MDFQTRISFLKDKKPASHELAHFLRTTGPQDHLSSSQEYPPQPANRGRLREVESTRFKQLRQAKPVAWLERHIISLNSPEDDLSVTFVRCNATEFAKVYRLTPLSPMLPEWLECVEQKETISGSEIYPIR